MLSVRIKRNFRKYFSYFNLVIFLVFLALLFFSIEVVTSYLTNSFVIDVSERGGEIAAYSAQNYTVADRKVHGVLQFESDKILDYLFVKKTQDHYLPEYLFLGFVLVQLFRINANWYEKKFTKPLYILIDTLGYVAAIVYFFSRVRLWYLDKLVKEFSNSTLLLDDNDSLNEFAIVIMLIAIGLGSFAKQGRKLQKDQDLTI